MTPPKATQALLSQAKASGQVVQVVTVPMGHHQMNESPEETLQALRDFLR
jgi:pimeloyl-ACP methyl ester carboxylesterase